MERASVGFVKNVILNYNITACTGISSPLANYFQTQLVSKFEQETQRRFNSPHRLMQISLHYPPNIERIRSNLDIKEKKGIVFTYGDTIYNPDHGDIDQALLVHEATHSLQQKKIGVEEWWDFYFADDDFRLRQEVEAYQNQYAEICRATKDRNRQARHLHQLAQDLSSDMYGSIVSHSEAKKLIIG
jgi:hypothetical protein